MILTGGGVLSVVLSYFLNGLFKRVLPIQVKSRVLMSAYGHCKLNHREHCKLSNIAWFLYWAGL